MKRQYSSTGSTEGDGVPQDVAPRHDRAAADPTFGLQQNTCIPCIAHPGQLDGIPGVATEQVIHSAPPVAFLRKRPGVGHDNLM
jgi:hypothetical protein